MSIKAFIIIFYVPENGNCDIWNIAAEAKWLGIDVFIIVEPIIYAYLNVTFSVFRKGIKIPLNQDTGR